MKSNREPEQKCTHPANRSSAAFLLAQVGAHAAARFAGRLRELELAPPHAGILRILSQRPGITQQQLATALNMVPSRLVELLDDLGNRGLIERREDPDDRRCYALHLTDKGGTTLAEIGRVAREHSRSLLAALKEEEQRQLADLLERIADEQGLTPGIHPGFARLGRR